MTSKDLDFVVSLFRWGQQTGVTTLDDDDALIALVEHYREAGHSVPDDAQGRVLDAVGMVLIEGNGIGTHIKALQDFQAELDSSFSEI